MACVICELSTPTPIPFIVFTTKELPETRVPVVEDPETIKAPVPELS